MDIAKEWKNKRGQKQTKKGIQQITQQQQQGQQGQSNVQPEGQIKLRVIAHDMPKTPTLNNNISTIITYWYLAIIRLG